MPEQEITNDELARMIKDQFDGIDKRFDALEKDVGQMKTDVGYLKSQMVTKEYLDDKLAKLWEDRRVSRMISMLAQKTVFSNGDVKELETLRPLVA